MEEVRFNAQTEGRGEVEEKRDWLGIQHIVSLLEYDWVSVNV